MKSDKAFLPKRDLFRDLREFTWALSKMMLGNSDESNFPQSPVDRHDLHFQPLHPSRYTYLEPETTIYKWMFGETTTFHVKIWNHPIETPIYKQMFQVPGRCHRCNLYNPPAFSLFTRGSTTATSVFSSVVKQELAKSADPPSIHGSPGGGVVQKMPDMTYLLGVFEPAPWEKYAEVKLGIISPGIGMKIKNI